jgi:fructose-1,6-bisphosphatase
MLAQLSVWHHQQQLTPQGLLAAVFECSPLSVLNHRAGAELSS